MPAYNGGQGRMEKCLVAANKVGIKNPVFADFLSSKPSDSILWKAMPEKYDHEGKYKEISEYVEYITKRVEQC